jgi:hypothetical protein
LKAQIADSCEEIRLPELRLNQRYLGNIEVNGNIRHKNPTWIKFKSSSIQIVFLGDRGVFNKAENALAGSE